MATSTTQSTATTVGRTAHPGPAGRAKPSGCGTPSACGATSASACCYRSPRPTSSCPAARCGPTLLAIVVGAVIGSVLLGLGAAAGAREGVPAMVLLRGLLGRRGLLPADGVQPGPVRRLGHLRDRHHRRGGVAGCWTRRAGRSCSAPALLATLMALRPLGSVRVLARYARVGRAGRRGVPVRPGALAAAAGLRRPGTGASSFWTAADIVIALPVSWFPLAADYTRHVRSGRTAFTGTRSATALATIAFFTLGVLALAAYGAAGVGRDRRAARHSARARSRLLVLVFVEVDEAFANIYSTAVSAQNVSAAAGPAGARGHRRCGRHRARASPSTSPATSRSSSSSAPSSCPWSASSWSPTSCVPRGAWDTSDTAPARPWLLLPWAAGFVAYQLTLPTFFAGTGAGWTAWWSARQADLGIDPANGWSASLVSLGGGGRADGRWCCLPAIVRAAAATAAAVRPAVIGRLHVLTDARAGRDALAHRDRSPWRPARRWCSCGSRACTDRELFDLGTRLDGGVRRARRAVPGERPGRHRAGHRGARHPPRRRRPAGRGGPAAWPARSTSSVAPRGNRPTRRALVADGRRLPRRRAGLRDRPQRTDCRRRLGPAGIGAVASAVPVPVIAIGGVTADRVAGAAGRRGVRRGRRRRRSPTPPTRPRRPGRLLGGELAS